MDRKTSKSSSSFRGRKRRMGSSPFPRSLKSNEMIYESRWEFGQLSSGTSGVISAASISPSIANTSEYSVIQNLFTEVRLLTCKVEFGPAVQTTTNTTSITMVCGTALLANGTTHASTPLAITDVQNLDRKSIFPMGLYVDRIHRYNMSVPKALEFSSITADAPATPTPWAGSPGCVYLFGDHATVSTPYLVVWVTARWHLRSRQ